ncbi:hypothetical protein [Parafilimonas sp.]|uniref:hypothetical protein n=1 Tax=Parafilimonas sp. TaxID=1969739 RepID=UPI003F811287
MDLHGAMKYGQNYYDFGEGSLVFTAPISLFKVRMTRRNQVIYYCPSRFLLSYPLAKKMAQYGPFSYAANEALHLSAHEKATTISILQIPVPADE